MPPSQHSTHPGGTTTSSMCDTSSPSAVESLSVVPRPAHAKPCPSPRPPCTKTTKRCVYMCVCGACVCGAHAVHMRCACGAHAAWCLHEGNEAAAGLLELDAARRRAVRRASRVALRGVIRHAPRHVCRLPTPNPGGAVVGRAPLPHHPRPLAPIGLCAERLALGAARLTGAPREVLLAVLGEALRQRAREVGQGVDERDAERSRGARRHGARLSLSVGQDRRRHRSSPLGRGQRARAGQLAGPGPGARGLGQLAGRLRRVEDAHGREVTHRLAEGAPARHAESSFGADVSVGVGIGGGGISTGARGRRGGGTARAAAEARLGRAVRAVVVRGGERAVLAVLEGQVERGEMLEGDAGRSAPQHRQHARRRAREDQPARLELRAAAALEEHRDRGGVDGGAAVEVEQ
eukprot:scaffold127083_cov66-Phaeocystis_antarctica.AAC.6